MDYDAVIMICLIGSFTLPVLLAIVLIAYSRREMNRNYERFMQMVQLAKAQTLTEYQTVNAKQHQQGNNFFKKRLEDNLDGRWDDDEET